MPIPPTREQVLTLLAAHPPRIAALTATLDAKHLHAMPEPDAWSINDVLAHLRSCGDMWGDCIASILAEDTPTIRAMNPTTWLKQTDYPDLPFHTSFEAYSTQRNDLLAALEPLAPDAWSRKAIIKGAGKPLERTVMFYAHWLATHERSHVKQIQRIVATLQTHERPARNSLAERGCPLVGATIPSSQE